MEVMYYPLPYQPRILIHHKEVLCCWTCGLSVHIVPGILQDVRNIVVHPDHDLIFLVEIYSHPEVFMDYTPGYCDGGILAIIFFQLFNDTINHLGINV